MFYLRCPICICVCESCCVYLKRRVEDALLMGFVTVGVDPSTERDVQRLHDDKTALMEQVRQHDTAQQAGSIPRKI